MEKFLMPGSSRGCGDSDYKGVDWQIRDFVWWEQPTMDHAIGLPAAILVIRAHWDDAVGKTYRRLPQRPNAADAVDLDLQLERTARAR
jgi:hypothetical protein